MLVLDASAIVDLLLLRPPAADIEGHLVDHGFELHAPYLIDVEIVSALRRIASSGDASPERAAAAIDDFLDLPIERHPHAALLPRVWQLRDSLTAYDATYVALAEALSDAGEPLLTTDARLARAVGVSSTIQTLLAA
jgi:predicted nucleic acid-binding protein